ncbi:MAG TPA: serine/threonine-protein kinase [Planctomycetota bacterium]|nr:serine/threonine-protein kinase [Planctomycetota bacterium]
MSNYETVFLAIASKNRFLTHEDAAQCLAEFRGQAEGARRTIEEIVSERGLLTAEQIRILGEAARKVTTRRTAAASPPPASAAPRDPQEPIPGIRITGKLGVGGTATVFLAEEAAARRSVALKVLHPSLARDEKAARRFRREAELLVEFDHPNLVKGYAQGLMGPLPYLVMEFLEGETAQEALDREKKFSEARALEIILEAAQAIDYIQSRGYVHRDIKPGNIFLCKDGRVKVLDLGFAQPMGSGSGGEEETTSGTVQYMSPEQARGQNDLDVRADIYSLGATLYHMVMGELPFTGADSLEVMAKQVMEALNSSEIKNRRLSRHMHYFIERMMSKDKDLRYATPRELVDDIREQIEGFRSLEYRPEEQDTAVGRFMGQDPAGRPPADPHATTRRLGRVTTRRISKLDEITRRFRKK